MVAAATPDRPDPFGGFADAGGTAEPVGSVADEAARLAQVLAARSAARAGSAARATSKWTAWAKTQTQGFGQESGQWTPGPGGAPSGRSGEARPGGEPSAGSGASAGRDGEPGVESGTLASPDDLASDELSSDELSSDQFEPFVTPVGAAFSDPPQRGAADFSRDERIDPGERPRHCQACGCGATAVCAACPICRAAGVVRLLSPQLLDTVADLASLAAGALREAAARQREGGASGDWDGPGHAGWPVATPEDPPAPPREEY